LLNIAKIGNYKNYLTLREYSNLKDGIYNSAKHYICLNKCRNIPILLKDRLEELKLTIHISYVACKLLKWMNKEPWCLWKRTYKIKETLFQCTTFSE